MNTDLSALPDLIARALGLPASVGWGATNRLYDLTGPADTSGLLVESWLAHEPVSAPFVLRLLCLSASAHLDPAAMLAQPVTLHTTLADGSRTSRTSRSALVLEAEPLASNGAAARYRLSAGPWFAHQRDATCRWMMAPSSKGYPMDCAMRAFQSRSLSLG